MTPSEFEERLRELIQRHAATTANVGCLACERCERCTDSTFLKDCRNVARSHYCSSCTDCTECTQSTELVGCIACSHCERCERCVGSAYLVRCIDCSGCTYCFGCVGLSKKDFHILNEPYERQEYFAMVSELRRALRNLSNLLAGGEPAWGAGSRRFSGEGRRVPPLDEENLPESNSETILSHARRRSLLGKGRGEGGPR